MDWRLRLGLNLLLAALLPKLVVAQEPGSQRIEIPRAFGCWFDDDGNRAVIGITTSTGSSRDTLGVLVSSVTPGSPAEKAGVEEGNRIAAINGVNLRVSPADVGDWDVAEAITRRLTREMGKVKAGDEVDLRVYSSGQLRKARIKTVAYDSLYGSPRSWREAGDQRAALGIGVAPSASKRDTLGVLVTFVDDRGPAAKAGVEEGNRIAAINSVDLRVGREDAGDELISDVKVRHMDHELERLKPGDAVELRVYSDGKFKMVTVKTVAASTLGHNLPTIFGLRGMMRHKLLPIPPIPPMPHLRALPPAEVTPWRRHIV